LEYALADLLTQGSYEAHLRRLCALMKQRLGHARRIVHASFPKGTKIYDPPAGYTLWVELPCHIDTMKLFSDCKERGIVVGPGQLFCASHKFRHCLRLSFAGVWGPQQQAALAEVGRLAGELNCQTRAIEMNSDLEVTRTDLMFEERVSAHDLW
jgi:DNA-binding transcriptional MocR family regulator